MPKLKEVIKPIENLNQEHQQWCFSNGWVVYPVVANGGYKVWYERGGQGKYLENDRVFKRSEVWQQVWNLYTKIYKHSKQK